MASIAAGSSSRVRLSKALQTDQELSARARELKELLHAVFDEDTPIELDLTCHETQKQLKIHVGEPGKGECTRLIGIPELLLTKTAWLKNVLLEMKERLDFVRNWLSQVRQLFRQIRGWIAKHRETFKVEEATITIFEAYTREYSAQKLIIRSGDKTVDILPRGAWWLTTEGRVDIVGENQEHTLVLSRAEGGWLWVEEGTDVTLHPLHGDLFVDLVKGCMG